MRWLVLVAVAGCGGGSSVSVCTPAGDYVWPADCNTAQCHATICDVTCPAGQDCPELDCTESPQCRIDCQPGVKCEHVDCTDAQDCFVDCEDTGSCSVTCENATGCSENCRADSECLLDCGTVPAAQCHLDMCPAGVVDCGNGVLVCNRACP